MSETFIIGLKKQGRIGALPHSAACFTFPWFYQKCGYLLPEIAGCRKKNCFCNIMHIHYLCNPNKEFFFEWLWESRKNVTLSPKKLHHGKRNYRLC
jgi:hypothetical protein